MRYFLNLGMCLENYFCSINLRASVLGIYYGLYPIYNCTPIKCEF